MGNILKAIADAIRAAMGTLRKVAKVTVRGLEWVWEQVPCVSFGGSGGGSYEPDERDVAQQAARQALAQQQKADACAEVNAAAQCVHRIARALRDGKVPESEDVTVLSPAQVKYLLGLTRAELEILAAASMAGLKCRRAFVTEMTPPDGCRPFELVARALEGKPVAESELRYRTLADRLRARKLGEDPAVDVSATVMKYSLAA